MKERLEAIRWSNRYLEKAIERLESVAEFAAANRLKIERNRLETLVDWLVGQS